MQQQVFQNGYDKELCYILYFFGLGKNTKKSYCWNHLSALFWLSKYENIAENLVVLNSLNGYETISTQYMFTPFSGWDRLFTKKEYPSLSRLGGFLRHLFGSEELFTKRDLWSLLFRCLFKLSKHEKTLSSSFVKLIKNWWHRTLS